MKQTAVEWLVEQIVNRTDRMYFLKELEQAKEMEKEQMKNMWRGGQWSVELGGEFDEYYNETFKSE